jgi:hypothetical protein
MSRTPWQLSPVWLAAGLLAVGLAPGCGINKSRLATEQMVVSDAVDRAVAGIDFHALSGRKVYFDTKYLDDLKMGPNGNVQYVISSLRQQMVACDVRLQDKAEEAEFIVEARLGVLANDGHEVTYGIPGSAAVTTAAVLLSGPVVPTPSMPELSVGRRNHQQGTAKIGVFAYDRVTREPVWQSGLARSTSRARDLWLFGLGPFEQRTTISPRPTERVAADSAEQKRWQAIPDPVTDYASPLVFRRALERPAARPEAASPVQPAAYAEPERLPAPPPSP